MLPFVVRPEVSGSTSAPVTGIAQFVAAAAVAYACARSVNIIFNAARTFSFASPETVTSPAAACIKAAANACAAPGLRRH